ncbi:MAG TPA: hypothetical protein VD966_02345 [Pyrinomonadaceae bacterium]|nr:hypothetical protein [Pyrinomonadaceae bacterium]
MRFALATLVALSCCCASISSDAYAVAKKPKYGVVEITSPTGSYPILVDGQPKGETSPSKREIQLDPGMRTIEVVLPDGSRWVRELNIIANRRICLVLNYRPRKITIAKSPCPYPVNVSAPATVNDGDTITFTADVNYLGSAALNYTWTVSPPSARITSGTGTPTITVDSTGLGKQRVMAILVVDDGSGDPNCRQSAQASTNVIAPPLPPVGPRKFDEFPSLAFDDLKARLDNLAIQLQNEPNAQGYIIVYSGRASRANQANRLGARARDYLVNQRGLNPSRLVIINGGYREIDTFEVWVVPQGAQPPQPSPTVGPGELRPEPGVRPRRSGRGRR